MYNFPFMSDELSIENFFLEKKRERYTSYIFVGGILLSPLSNDFNIISLLFLILEKFLK